MIDSKQRRTTTRRGRDWRLPQRLVCVLGFILLAAALRGGHARTATALGSGIAATPHDLEALLDAVIGEGMVAHHVPGAAVGVVQDGEVVLLKGYGFADLEQRIPVDPERTVFRVASVSKLFTIAAVLQLGAQGELALEADVNAYLTDWKVARPFPEPVRVRHLLAHTDGFGTRDLATFALSPEDVLSLGETLARERPAPVAAPGRVITYGGYGTALAGHLVELVSGLAFEDYVAAEIFAPLGMSRSSFAQVLPQPLADDVATVYDYDANTGYLPSPFVYLHTPPTGGLSTTVLDLTRMLAALLDEGRIEGRAVLDPSVVEAMLAHQFTPHPDLPGVTYGFMEQVRQGQRVLIRDGSGLGLHAQILLLPDDGLGYIYVQNSRGDGVVDSLSARFMQHLFPQVIEPLRPESQASPRDYAGLYRPAQTNLHTLVKLESLLVGELRVTADDDTLTVVPRGMGDVYGGFDAPSVWVAVTPDLFTRLGREHLLAFVCSDRGRLWLCSDSGYHGCYERIHWYASSSATYLLLGVCISVFFGTLVTVPLRRRALLRAASQARIAWAVAFACSALYLVGLLGAFYALFLRRVAGLPAFAAGLSPLAVFMLALLTAGACLSLALIPVGAWAWRRGLGRGRWAYSGFAATALLFAAWLLHWKLILP